MILQLLVLFQWGLYVHLQDTPIELKMLSLGKKHLKDLHVYFQDISSDKVSQALTVFSMVRHAGSSDLLNFTSQLQNLEQRIV